MSVPATRENSELLASGRHQGTNAVYEYRRHGPYVYQFRKDGDGWLSLGWICSTSVWANWADRGTGPALRLRAA